MALYEKEVCAYLNIPSIPKRKWDGQQSFINGVAMISLQDGGIACAVAEFDNERDKKPFIKRVFGLEPFVSVTDIFVVPAYMEVDLEQMDLDDQSKDHARFLVEESNEMINDTSNEKDVFFDCDSEYYFDNIHNDEEAMAFIKAYNKKKGIKGRVPQSHEGLVMRLSVIYADLNKNNNK